VNTQNDYQRPSIGARLRAAPWFALIWLVSAIGQAVETSERRKGRPPIT